MIIHELDTGLLLEVGGRNLATVDASRGYLELRSRRGRERSYAASITGLRAACELIEAAAQRHRDEPNAAPRQPDLFARSAPPDARLYYARELGPLLLGALRRAARLRQPQVDAAEAAVARERATPLVLFGPLLELPFFTRDASRLRAAAIAAAFVETVPQASESVACATALCGKLHEWPRLFSPTGTTSRALHKTLAELPAEAAAKDVWALRGTLLVRPLRSALHLRLIAERARGAEPCKQEQLTLVQQAEEDELVEVRARVARALRLDETDERAVEHALVELLARCGAPRPTDTLRSLLRRGLLGGTRGRDREWAHAEARTAPPPISPPPFARLLATVGEVVEEGKRMRHCVGSHAVDAVTGHAFIFHAVVNRTPVTIEVNDEGRVVEAAGAANAKDAAVLAAARLLGAWGAGFWAARVGGLELSTWVEPAPSLPPACAPLRSVEECLAVFHSLASKVEPPWRELVSWFEEHVARAVGGKEWLVARTRARGPRVLALDARGGVVSGLSARGSLPATEAVAEVRHDSGQRGDPAGGEP